MRVPEHRDPQIILGDVIHGRISQEDFEKEYSDYLRWVYYDDFMSRAMRAIGRWWHK